MMPPPRTDDQRPRTMWVRRLRRRRQQRGAAVFIVMMAIVLLSGLGIWTMHSTSLVDQAAGYSRASRQTQFAAELGLESATAYLSQPGLADANYKQASLGTENCQTATGTFCRRIDMANINQVTQQQAAVDVVDNLSTAGSFGPKGTGQPGALQGRFEVEMVESRVANVAGDDMENKLYRRVTLTSFGVVRPDPAGITALCGDANPAGVSAQNSAAGQVGMRSHSVIGPIY